MRMDDCPVGVPKWKGQWFEVILEATGKQLRQNVLHLWDWCEENCKGKWGRASLNLSKDKQTLVYRFEHEADAMAFKLRWC